MTHIRVGITEWHGMMQESSSYPPQGIAYSDVQRKQKSVVAPFRSPIKGFMPTVNSNEHDLIEAVISPVITENRWIYSLAHFAEALAFSIYGVPLPRSMRSAYIQNMLKKDNCKKIIFWSHAGLETFTDYGRVKDTELLQKTTVVYPAVRETSVTRSRSRSIERSSLVVCFGGDFFRKGGATLVDAFERAQAKFPNIKLRLCCDEKLDFNTSNDQLKKTYLAKIRRNENIVMGRVSHEKMITEVLPGSDIYALPTYVEAFGVAIIEAMSVGLPVISTNFFAIPEMVEDGSSGFLIDTTRFECEKMFRGYVVRDIPEEFGNYMSEKLYEKLCSLLESATLRTRMGERGEEIVRTKFSIQKRNARMREIYEEAVG